MPFIVKRNAGNTFICSGITFVPGLNVFSVKAQEKVFSNRSFQDQCGAELFIKGKPTGQKIMVIIEKSDGKEKDITKSSGKRETDAAIQISKMEADTAIATTAEVLDAYTLKEVIRIDARSNVASAAKIRLNEIGPQVKDD
jgi:hypothetical protein